MNERIMSWCVGGLGLLILTILGPIFLHAQVGSLKVVSTAGGTAQTAGSGGTLFPWSATGPVEQQSADGRFMAWTSSSTNVVTGVSDTNAAGDVFLYDRLNGTNQLVTHSAASLTTTANGASSFAFTSADGNWVVFASVATNLVSGVSDTNGTYDLFLWERTGGAITLVTLAAGGSTTGNGQTSVSRVSQDGRYVVFSSQATNLVSGGSDSNAAGDAFIYDRLAGSITLVSHAASSATTAGNGGSTVGSMSADARYIAFTTLATDIVSGVTDANGSTDMYCWDRVTGATILVSHSASSNTTTGSAQLYSRSAMSADGNYLAYVNYSNNLVAGQTDFNANGDYFLWDRQANTNSLVSHVAGSNTAASSTVNVGTPPPPPMPYAVSISANGRYVAYYFEATDIVAGFTGEKRMVYLYDRLSQANVLISHAVGSSSSACNSPATYPWLSEDGSVVAYASGATDLVAGFTDANGTGADCFAYLVASGTSLLLSRSAASATTTGNSGANWVSPSLNGRVFYHQSTATDLGYTDTNALGDVATVALLPNVAGASPSSGTATGGTTVTITGTRLTGVSSVSFGGTAASSVTVVSDTQITAVTPAHTTGVVDVAVDGLYGAALLAGGFTFTTVPPNVMASVTSLNLGSTMQGTAGTPASYTVSGTNLGADLVVTAPSGTEVSLTSGVGYSSSLSLAPAGGTVATTTIYARIASSASAGSISGNITNASSGATTRNVALSGTVNAPPTPTITVSVTSLNLGSTAQGTAGTPASYTVSGAGLSANIQVSAPANTEISLSSGGGYGPTLSLAQSGGAVATTTIYARIATGAAAGSISGNITNASSGAVTRNVALSGTVNAPPTPSVSFATATATFSEAGGSQSLTVNLSSAYPQAVTVNYATTNGSAAAGSDYTAASGTLTIAASQTSTTISIPVSNDTLDEANETFSVTLSSPSNATLGTPVTVVVTITDDDAAPLIRLASSSTSVSESAGSVNFTVNLGAVSGRDVTVNYASGGYTATPGSDYVAANGTLTITAGQTSGSFSVSITDDMLNESTEMFGLTLSAPVNATLGSPSTQTVAISDNDPMPTVGLSAATYTVAENIGTASLSVTLSAASGRDVTFSYASTAGTAAAGSDYTSASGTLTILAGSTAASVAVTIANDTLDENDENFTLALSSPANATLGTGSATVTITDDDATPSVNFGSVPASVIESAGNLSVPVNLSAVSGRDVTVNYTIGGGTATSGSDYSAAGGNLTIAAGQSSGSFQVTIVDDTTDEPNQWFNVALSAPVNATLGTPASADIDITDNDAPPTVQLSAANTNITEANANANVTVSLSAASEFAISVDWAATAGTATAGIDFVAAGGTLNFTAGQTSGTVSVAILDDAQNETDETINLALANSVNASLGGQSSATITINDNDGTPALNFSVSNVNVAENGGTATLTVQLSVASGLTITVDYATANASATAASDYAAAAGSLTFGPGVTSQSVVVTLNDDQIDEPNETFSVTLSNAANATLGGTAQSTVTIQDDEATPTLQFSAAASQAGEQAGTVTLTVTLSGASASTVTVSFASGGGTAMAGTDYQATSGTLTFLPGEMWKDILVTISDDAADEPAESFDLTLSGPTNALLGGVQVQTVTILVDPSDIGSAVGGNSAGGGTRTGGSCAASVGSGTGLALLLPLIAGLALLRRRRQTS